MRCRPDWPAVVALFEPDATVTLDLGRGEPRVLGPVELDPDPGPTADAPVRERALLRVPRARGHAAPADLAELRALRNDTDMRMVLFIPDVASDQADLRLKVFRKNASMSLSEVLPHLSLLGVKVIDERPYEFDLPEIGHAAIYDFGLTIRGGRDRLPDWTPAARERFNDAFCASFTGRTEADQLNGLVTAAGLKWQEVAWLRLIARYLKQVGASWSQDSIAQALLDEVMRTYRIDPKKVIVTGHSRYGKAALVCPA